MDMNVKTCNSLLTAMVCMALSSGTAWAATPDLDVAGTAAQHMLQQSDGTKGTTDKQGDKAAQTAQPAAAPAVQAKTQESVPSDRAEVAKKAAELHQMPLRWQAVPTTKQLEQAAKPQPVIITADDIKAQRKAERRQAVVESVKGRPQAPAAPQAGQPSLKPVQSLQPVSQAPLAQPVQQAQQVKPAGQVPLAQPVQQAKQVKPAGQVPLAQPVQQARQVKPVGQVPLVQPVQRAQQVKSAGQVSPAQPAPQLQQVPPARPIPSAQMMEVSRLAHSEQAAHLAQAMQTARPAQTQQDGKPGPLKLALQALQARSQAQPELQMTAAVQSVQPVRPQPGAGQRQQPLLAGMQPSAAALTQKAQPQIRTAQDEQRKPAQQIQPRPAEQPGVQRPPANPGHGTVVAPQGQIAPPPKHIQVERPAEFEGVSDEVVRHILAGEFAMNYQLRQDPSEPGVYKLTQILNQNQSLTHLQKIEYLIGFGRAINRSNLKEWEKRALIHAVVEAFD